jgi:hypothetical protein
MTAPAGVLHLRGAPRTAAARHNRFGSPASNTDDSFVLLLWLFAAAVVLPGAVDLPFIRGEVPTASQLNSLIGRGLFAALAIISATTIIRGSRPTPLFGALACLWGVLFGVSFYVGEASVSLMRYFWIFLLAIALSAGRIELTRLLWHAKVILRVILVICLASVLVAPEYAWGAPGSTGRQWLGVPQLSGVTQSPNALGPLAALSFLLELTSPERRKQRWIFGSLALAILVLTQSRGGWSAGVLGLLVLTVLSPQGRVRQGRALLLPVIGVPLVVFFLASAQSDGRDVTNSRLGLWQSLIERSFAGQTWLFGNGNGVYFATRGTAEGFDSWVGQGHNQFVDSFFTGGIVALVPLLVLTFISAKWALRAGPNRRIALAAFAVLFIQMMVETPLRQASSPWSLMSVIVLAIITAHGAGMEQLSPVTHPRTSTLRRPVFTKRSQLRDA